jgi:hypothetical protein
MHRTLASNQYYDANQLMNVGNNKLDLTKQHLMQILQDMTMVRTLNNNIYLITLTLYGVHQVVAEVVNNVGQYSFF